MLHFFAFGINFFAIQFELREEKEEGQEKEAKNDYLLSHRNVPRVICQSFRSYNTGSDKKISSKLSAAFNFPSVEGTSVRLLGLPAVD